MRGTFLLLTAVSRTVGFTWTHTFGRKPALSPTRAGTDAAAEDSGAGDGRIDAVAAQTDGVEAQTDVAETTEDADTAILRELEDEVTRLDAARQEC